MRRICKQLLALLLCAALSLGIGANGLEVETRHTLSDLDDCAHREAVLLMSDLGVIDGKADGTFAPNETIDRASMAKLIYGIMMGSADPKNFLGVSTGLTDIEGTWAESYINYCYSVGIISGSGGKFMPTGNVTVDAAAKMLLVALGYDAKHRGYEGSKDWAENIRRDAATLGLLEGVSQAGTDNITRDNAAQMIYNTLFAQVRTPVYGVREGEMRIIDYKTEPDTLGLRSFGLVKCTLAVGEVDPESSRVPLTLVELAPRGEIVRDESGVIDDIALGRAGFTLGPEWAKASINVYLKVDYTVKEGALRELALQSVYSSEPSRLSA